MSLDPQHFHSFEEFFQQSDVFALLGIEGIEGKRREKFLGAMTKTVFGNVLLSYSQHALLNSEDMQYLEGLAGDPGSSQVMVDFLELRSPRFHEDLAWQTVAYKRTVYLARLRQELEECEGKLKAALRAPEGKDEVIASLHGRRAQLYYAIHSIESGDFGVFVSLWGGK